MTPDNAAQGLQARRLAHTVLVRVDAGGAFASRALDAALREAGKLDPRDAAFATELVYGTLRRVIAIDHALKHFSRTPLADLDTETRALVRLGAYQLLYLRVPERAAVHTSVELAKELHRGAPTKFVNAVLRALLRDRANVLVPPETVDPAGNLSITEAFPRWLVELCLAEWGFEETKVRLRAMNHPASLDLRVNVLRGDRPAAMRALKEQHGLDAVATKLSPSGLEAEGGSAGGDIMRPDHGLWQAQDEAAQLVGFLCAPTPGETVLDACAAPGGKTCHLAELMGNQGRIDAVDVHLGKLQEIRSAATKLGLTIIQAHAADVTKPLPFADPAGYGLVLADVPCSALGTIRRHPELKTRRTLDDIHRLAAVQREMLDRLAGYVRPGGVLVYAVCTFTKTEGPAQVDAFLARHPAFTRERPSMPGVDWGAVLSPAGDLVLDPHRHGTDGFYAARLRRAA